MFYYITDENGRIEQFSEIVGTPPTFMTTWEKTNDKIIRLHDGSLAFEKDVDLKEEERIIEERKRQDAVNEEIWKLKQKLADTDYKCLKYVDGALSESEYAETKAYRAELREQINELEGSL